MSYESVILLYHQALPDTSKSVQVCTSLLYILHAYISVSVPFSVRPCAPGSPRAGG